MIVVEITGAVNSSGSLNTFYLSTDSFTTQPTDTPANVSFEPRLIDPASIGINAFSDSKTGGATKLEVGEVLIANLDGALDGWLNYSFDGRPIIIRSGTSGAAYPSGFQTVLSGTVESIDANWHNIIIKLRDKQWYFTTPILTTAYLGNNTLPNGLEGVPTDIGGKLKPKCYGTVFNISPPVVNTSKLTYQVNRGVVNDIPAVYDKGLALTKGADFATSALLQAASPAAGTYITCFAEGYFRLGSSPAGTVTADIVQGATAANRTVAQILKQIALDSGLSSGEISSADVTALDAANSSVVGIWIYDSSNTFAATMDSIAASIGAYYGFDSFGILRMSRLTTTSGTSLCSFYDYDIHNGVERSTSKDIAIPAYRANVQYQKIFTTQTSDYAGATTTDRKAYLATEYRTVYAEDTSIPTQWLRSQPMTFTTLLTTSSDANTEAARLLSLYKVRRDVFQVPINLKSFTTGNAGNPLKILDEVSIFLPRFGMTSGRNFKIIGWNIQLQQEICTLTLWG